MTAKRKTGLSRPPAPAGADDFISGATAHPPAQEPAAPAAGGDKPAEGYPWAQPHVRADVRKTFNVRLSEPEYLQLKWLAERSPESMHDIVHAAVGAEIDRRLAAIGVAGGKDGEDNT